jgi:5'-nucleotidase
MSNVFDRSRREFIARAAGLAVLTAGSGLTALASTTKARKLTILHTNDTHSQIDPFSLKDPDFPGMGGISKRAEIIKKVRDEEENVLLLDSGDIYQGTPYFNFYGGSIEFKLMSMLGYDASTMGNHDFDIGLDGFLRNLPYAKFPFLCSNYDFKNTMLDGKTQSYKIFEKQGLKIGVFGLGVKLDGLVLGKQYLETKYQDPVEIATDMSRLLKIEKQCDYVICLSHLGYKYETAICDVKLAQQTRHIDLILGGHSHTFLDNPVPYKNLDGKDVLIAQTGRSGIRLGRIDVIFESVKASQKREKGELISVS